jgi:hypothetical protein
MVADRRFGRWFGLPGIVVAAALYILNFATFPIPPESAGLVDVGPLVGLWYAVVWVQVLRLGRVAPAERGFREPLPHPEPGSAGS